MKPQFRPRRLSLEASLGAIYHWSRELATLRERLAAALPAPEAEHLAGVSLQADRLLVFADSTAWCTRLRYRASILETAVEPLLGLRPQLEFRTLPPVLPAARRQRCELSPVAAESLRAAARGVSEPALARALERLADSQPATGPSAGPA
ncbi:MAG TPA: DciA family protein [Gammaproteobacteria bacterium]|nr:DciA family protein [Gammaproteobacteria bacterium]